MEEMLYSNKGGVISIGPGAVFFITIIQIVIQLFIAYVDVGMYKIPSFRDVPLEFNVSLLRNAPNPRAIHSSKAVGEVYYFCGHYTTFYHLSVDSAPAVPRIVCFLCSQGSSYCCAV
jgi:hypothetical protein